MASTLSLSFRKFDNMPHPFTGYNNSRQSKPGETQGVTSPLKGSSIWSFFMVFLFLCVISVIIEGLFYKLGVGLASKDSL